MRSPIFGNSHNDNNSNSTINHNSSYYMYKAERPQFPWLYEVTLKAYAKPRPQLYPNPQTLQPKAQILAQLLWPEVIITRALKSPSKALTPSKTNVINPILAHENWQSPTRPNYLCTTLNPKPHTLILDPHPGLHSAWCNWADFLTLGLGLEGLMDLP